ncbi:MAG: exodeoxyribonuclease VII small subunit [Planctomycetaceae bacterium]
MTSRRDPNGRTRDAGAESPPLEQSAPPAPSAGQAGSTPPLSFEAGLERLTDIVARLEGTEAGLAEAIAAYEEGVALVRHLHRQLAECEQRVEMLAAVDRTDGAGTADGTAAGESAPRRSGPPREPPPASRPGRPRRLPGMDDAERGV